MPIAVAVYRPEHYARLLATAEDASDLEPTWQEWYTVYQETKRKMAGLGMDLIEVTVDLDDLEKYCQEQGLKNTSGTRAQYAAHVLDLGRNDFDEHDRTMIARQSIRRLEQLGYTVTLATPGEAA